MELERPGVDAEGLEAWLSQRAWGKHLESMDHDVEAMRGAIHSVNSLVGYRGIENLTRDELYTYQVCSCPSPGASRNIKNIKIAQELCPEVAWGPRLRNKSVKVRRSHTFFDFYCTISAPRPLRGHSSCILIF